MAFRGKPRPPVPPKYKPRCFSDRSGYEKNANDSFEFRSFQTLPNKGIEITEAESANSGRSGSSVGSPPNNPLEGATGSFTMQAPPPDDCRTVLSLPSVEPQTFQDEEVTPVFFTCNSLPSNSSRRESAASSEASESDFRYERQTSSGGQSQSISDRLEDAKLRRFSDVTTPGSDVVIESFYDSFQESLSASLLSVRIEPSPERTLSHCNEKNFASDPELLESTNHQNILRSDPDDELERKKHVKGKVLRPSMLMLSRSLADLHSFDEGVNNSSPEKKKVDIEKLNRFFGESRETATELEASIYHLLISGNQLTESLPAAVDGSGRAKKSASTWFLSPKALDSLPERPLDTHFVQKTRKSTADELSTIKFDRLTEKGKQIMKSFKKRVVGVANLAEGLTQTEEMHGTFDIPIEDCVMSASNKFVPLLVEKCVKVIEEFGLQVEGIYRLSGNGLAVSELQEELDKEPAVINENSEKWTEVHVVTNILKLFFRKLTNSLITDELYESAIQLNSISHREKRLLKLKVLLAKLPKVNYETFKFLSNHLNKVASFWNVNKMDAHNLAIMFGPTLVRSPRDQTLVMIKDMHHQTTIVETIIKHSSWLFSGWANRLVPMDEVTEDDSASSTSNLQLLESAETLVARQLRVVPVEEKSSFFSFQGQLRRSRRRHRNKSGKDETGEAEQKTVPDAEREIELHRVKIPDLPFKAVRSFNSENKPSHKTLFDGRSKAKRPLTDAKTLDIRLVSSKLDDEKKENLSHKNEDQLVKTDSESSMANGERKVAGRGSAPFEIKKYKAYDAEVRATTLTKALAVQQPTILKKYSSKPNLGPSGIDASTLKTSPVNSLKAYSGPSLAQGEKENQKSVPSSHYKHSNAVGYHPDVSQLPLDDTDENAYLEHGSLKKTNIVVRGPFGRRYCVLSGTEPSVLLNAAPPSDKPLRVVEYLDKKQCAMTCVINIKLNVIQDGAHDIELRRVQYV